MTDEPDAVQRQAPRITAGRAAAVGIGVVLAGAILWLIAERWLLPTVVPSGLRLAHLSPSDLFSRSYLSRSASYERFLVIDGLLATVVLLVVLGVYAVRGHRLMGQSAAGPIGTGMMLGMLGFGLVWLAELPFGLAAVWWERRHHVSHQGYVSSVAESFAALGGRFLFVSLAILVAMALARVLRGWWFIAAAPAFAAIALLAAFLNVYLIPSVHPLHDRALLAEVRTLERVEKVPQTKIEVQDVSRLTSAANAETIGLGSTRRVILWSTLLSSHFTKAELRSVIAHELGHVAHEDILKGVGWLAIFLLPTTALIALATCRYGGMARPEAVPVALLVAIAVSVVLIPVRNVISRRVEAAADWAALQATHDPGAQRALMRKLARESLTNPNPPSWSYVLYADHPTIMQRIAMTRAWEGRRAAGR